VHRITLCLYRIISLPIQILSNIPVESCSWYIIDKTWYISLIWQNKLLKKIACTQNKYSRVHFSQNCLAFSYMQFSFPEPLGEVDMSGPLCEKFLDWSDLRNQSLPCSSLITSFKKLVSNCGLGITKYIHFFGKFLHIWYVLYNILYSRSCQFLFSWLFPIFLFLSPWPSHLCQTPSFSVQECIIRMKHAFHSDNFSKWNIIC